MNEQVLHAPRKQALLNRPKIILLLLSLLLISASLFRLGIEVKIGSWTSQGVYHPWELLKIVNGAEALAGEILMENVSLRESIDFRLKLTYNNYSNDTRGLTRALFDNNSNITKLCAVKIDGTFVGWLTEPSQLGEILEVILAENSTPTTISANFTQKITAEYSYAPADTSIDVTAISAAIRKLCSVETVSLISDGGLPPSQDGINPTV